MPDADPVSLRLWVSLGVAEVDGVADALPVDPSLPVCVTLGVTAWLGDWVELRLDVCDGDWVTLEVAAWLTVDDTLGVAL